MSELELSASCSQAEAKGFLVYFSLFHPFSLRKTCYLARLHFSFWYGNFQIIFPDFLRYVRGLLPFFWLCILSIIFSVNSRDSLSNWVSCGNFVCNGVQVASTIIVPLLFGGSGLSSLSLFVLFSRHYLDTVSISTYIVMPVSKSNRTILIQARSFVFNFNMFNQKHYVSYNDREISWNDAYYPKLKLIFPIGFRFFCVPCAVCKIGKAYRL